MWKIKNKEAVSPVIGVILMVAITVVLAAVLYVWVSGFMTTSSGGVYAISTSTLSGDGDKNATASVISTQPSSGIKNSTITWQLWDVTDSAVEASTISGSTVTGGTLTADSYVAAGCTIKVTMTAVHDSNSYKLRAIVGGSQVYESAAFTF